MLEDLDKFQVYKIYYKNANSVLPRYFQKFIPDYNTAIDDNDDLRHTNMPLPTTKKEYYVAQNINI